MKSLKKIVMVGIVVLFGISPKALAQIDIQPFVGWQFGGKAQFYEGELNIKSDINYGLMLDVGIHHGMALELYYSQMNTTADWSPYRGYEQWWPATTINMDVHYMQVGGIKYFENGPIEPFGGLTLGATWFEGSAQDTDNSETVTRFAITLGGGIKIMPSDKIGIRLQGRLLMPMYFAGVGLWAGTGGGGASVNGGIPIIQGDLTAALVIRLGE